MDIQGGDQTPADIRIIPSHGLKVNNSSLTGESVPIALKTQDPNHMESKNLAFYSTNVVVGNDRGSVIKTQNDLTIVKKLLLCNCNYMEKRPFGIFKKK